MTSIYAHVQLLALVHCLILTTLLFFSGVAALSNRGHCGYIFISRESARGMYAANQPKGRAVISQ